MCRKDTSRQYSSVGKTNQEIAEELSVSKETVHSQKKIAYRKLRDYLKDYYFLLFFFM